MNKDNKDNIEMGERIRTLRKNQKLTRETLAELSNISTQFLADIESGKKGMTVFTLKKICLALHVTPNYIVYGNENESSFDISPMIASLSQDKQIQLKGIIQEIIKLL
ncbi:MAG: helix-turn-helix transcriptional regulator [Eubacteriales bacterium]|nr:helix-turn-helix transcriptional regulator [Eubacteriales bacterium]